MVRTSRPAPVAYSIEGAAEAMGCSTDPIRKAIKAGDLTPRYLGSKPVILHTDLLEWAESRPVDRP